METTIIYRGNIRGFIGDILGLYWGYITSQNRGYPRDT